MFFDLVPKSEVQKRWAVPSADANVAAWTPQSGKKKQLTRHLISLKPPKNIKNSLGFLSKYVRPKAQLFEDSASFAITSIELSKNRVKLYEPRCHWLLLSVYSIHACFYGPQHLRCKRVSLSFFPWSLFCSFFLGFLGLTLQSFFN